MKNKIKPEIIVIPYTTAQKFKGLEEIYRNLKSTDPKLTFEKFKKHCLESGAYESSPFYKHFL